MGNYPNIPAAQRMVIEEYETQLQLLSQDNTRALSGVDPARMAIVQKSAHLPGCSWLVSS